MDDSGRCLVGLLGDWSFVMANLMRLNFVRAFLLVAATLALLPLSDIRFKIPTLAKTQE